MKPTKEKIYGITGSILFHIGLLLILYFTFLRTKIKVKEEGVPVNFGTVHLATGTFTPQSEVNEATPREANLSPPDQEIPEIPQSLYNHHLPNKTDATADHSKFGTNSSS